MSLIMNYKGLGERYGKPKRKPKKKESWYRYGSIMDYEDIKQEKALKKLIEKQHPNGKKIAKQQPKRKRKSSAKKKKKATKELTYQEQLLHPMWLKKRNAVLDRYGHQCFRCGSTLNLNVHHLSYKKGKLAWEYPISNFVVLCKDCHSKVHANKDDEYYPIYK